MRPLAALERFLERLFERPTARLLRASVEPVTLARRIERAIDEARRAGPEGMLAPTRFTVEVGPADAASLARLATLEEDLAGVALAHARRRGYRIPERPTVAVVGSPSLEPGTCDRGRLRRPAPGADRARRAPEQTWSTGSRRRSPPGTAIRVATPGRPPRTSRSTATADDRRPRGGAEVAVADPLVSRHHARLAARAGRLVLTDLGSRNGTRVNGEAVREAVVGPGDRLEIGATRLAVVPPEAAAEGGWTPD